MISSRLFISVGSGIFVRSNVRSRKYKVKRVTLDVGKEFNYDILWERVKSNLNDDSGFENEIKYLLSEYGTSRVTNRFTVGNTIEIIISKMLRNSGYNVKRSVDSKRYDIEVDDSLCERKFFSVKYSSKRNIIIANSFGSEIKKDSLCDMLLLTPKNLFLLNEEKMRECGINLDDYLMIGKDNLQLNRRILKKLIKNMYPYVVDVDISVDSLKNRSTVDLFYKQFEKDFIEHEIVNGKDI